MTATYGVEGPPNVRDGLGVQPIVHDDSDPRLSGSGSDVAVGSILMALGQDSGGRRHTQGLHSHESSSVEHRDSKVRPAGLFGLRSND
jgi:hypothetical protein